MNVIFVLDDEKKTFSKYYGSKEYVVADKQRYHCDPKKGFKLKNYMYLNAVSEWWKPWRFIFYLLARWHDAYLFFFRKGEPEPIFWPAEDFDVTPRLMKRMVDSPLFRNYYNSRIFKAGINKYVVIILIVIIIVLAAIILRG